MSGREESIMEALVDSLEAMLKVHGCKCREYPRTSDNVICVHHLAIDRAKVIALPYSMAKNPF